MAVEEHVHGGFDFLGLFFHDEASAFGEGDHVGVRPSGSPFVQVVGGEEFVFHSPEDLEGLLGEGFSADPEVVEPGAGAYVALGEDVGAVAVGGFGEGAGVLGIDLAGDLLLLLDHAVDEVGEAGVGGGEGEFAHGTMHPVVEFLEAGVVFEGPEEGVDDADAVDPAGVIDGVGEGDGAAEIVDYQAEGGQADVVEQLFEIAGVGLGGVAPAGRLIGEAEADVVHGDAAVLCGEVADEAAPHKGPRGEAVDEDDGFALTVVDVVHASAVDVRKFGHKGELTVVQPWRNGSVACNAHQYLLLREECLIESETAFRIRRGGFAPQGYEQFFNILAAGLAGQIWRRFGKAAYFEAFQAV